MRHDLLLLLLTSIAFFIATSLATIAAYLFFAPAIKFSPTPLAVPPAYSDIGAPPSDGKGKARAIKAEEQDVDAAYSRLLQFRQEGEDLIASPLSTSQVTTEEGTATGDTGTGTVTETGSGSVVTDDEGEEESGSDSGSEVDLGASATR